ncbi:hypothetical protein [Roseateles flavus]|uniref:Uncharacterized protein n=1 Tax=Roseateles flavus TaxID=3149041 RepID=A0ABV0GGF6_9BURK
MGKGVKMRSAMDRQGVLYTVEGLQQMEDASTALPTLVCDDPGCQCEVRFVPRHLQNRANRIEPVEVQPYIGLRSHATHATGCRYDAEGKLKIIAADSDPDFLSALEDGKRELRLLALHNGLRRRSQPGQPAGAPGIRLASGGGKVATDIETSEKKLDRYLRTTADLLALRSVCESDEDLAGHLVLRLGTKRIPWKNFYFERKHFDDAWESIRTLAANAHPIAIVGVVRALHTPKAGTSHKNSFLNCLSMYRKTDTPNLVETFEVSVAHEDSAWLAGFPVGSEIIMFGLWKAADAVPNTVPDKQAPGKFVTYITHKLTLWPQFRKQVLRTT